MAKRDDKFGVFVKIMADNSISIVLSVVILFLAKRVFNFLNSSADLLPTSDVTKVAENTGKRIEAAKEVISGQTFYLNDGRLLNAEILEYDAQDLHKDGLGYGFLWFGWNAYADGKKVVSILMNYSFITFPLLSKQYSKVAKDADTKNTLVGDINEHVPVSDRKDLEHLFSLGISPV